MDHSDNSVQDPESKLIDLAKQGDGKAFGELVKQFEDTVYSFAFKVCRDHEKAVETAQDTFVNVYLKLNQFDGKSKFSTWLYSIVANNCLMKRRKTKLEESSVSIDESSDIRVDDLVSYIVPWDPDPAETLLTNELKNVLDEAIKKLPMEYRVVFVMRDVEQMAGEEVAEVLGLSLPAMKSRLRRARLFLRNELRPYMEVKP
ncbi:MAG: sigma-70 family RNA polymerase sigma factor [Ignavibacteria bacterium]|nr:sigma-70 family RNA polymerase sigma factor [Ignavibacteria bacterium]